MLYEVITDDRLVGHHVVQYRAEGVLGGTGLVRNRFFHRLADGDGEASRAVRVLRQYRPARVGGIAGAGDAGSAPGLHEHLPEGLLLEALV